MNIRLVNKHGLIEWHGRLYRNVFMSGKTVSFSESGPETLGFKDVTGSVLPIGLKG
jgi:hypothetical protein